MTRKDNDNKIYSATLYYDNDIAYDLEDRFEGTIQEIATRINDMMNLGLRNIECGILKDLCRFKEEN